MKGGRQHESIELPADELAAHIVEVANREPDERERLLIVARDYLEQCSDDELRVVVGVLRRLEVGRERYGRLDLASDTRDWQRELGEELFDACIYAAIVRLAELRDQGAAK